MNFKEYYEKYWEKRIKTRSRSLPPIRRIIPRFLIKYSQYGTILNQVPANSKLLDIGCGEGNVSALFLIRKNCQVTGIDISEEALRLAKKRGINTKRWDLNEVPLPFRDKSFEAITMIDILEHVIDPRALLSEAKRLLIPSGRLIVSLPNFARWDNRIRMILGRPRDILHWEGYDDGLEHLHWFTKKKLIHFLKEIGFKRNRFVPTGLPFGFFFGLFKTPGLARILTVVSQKDKEPISPKLRKAAQRVKEHFYPNYYSKRYQASLDEIMRYLKGPRVLELGTGSGWLLREMHRRNLKVTGIDYSKKSLKESRFIFASENLRIPLVRGTAERLPFKKESFDSITMLGVLEHIPQPERALGEINRVLKKGGVFFVSVPNTYTYGMIYDRFISPVFNKTSLGYDRVMNRQFSTIGLRRIHEPLDDHIIQFTAKSLKNMLFEGGFKIMRFSNMETFTSYLASLFCGLLRLNRKFINPLEILDVKISRYIPLNLGAGWLAICKKE